MITVLPGFNVFSICKVYLELSSLGCFLLKSGIQIPISRLKYRNVREQFLEYSYSKVRGGQYGGTAY